MIRIHRSVLIVLLLLSFAFSLDCYGQQQRPKRSGRAGAQTTLTASSTKTSEEIRLEEIRNKAAEFVQKIIEEPLPSNDNEREKVLTSRAEEILDASPGLAEVSYVDVWNDGLKRDADGVRGQRGSDFRIWYYEAIGEIVRLTRIIDNLARAEDKNPNAGKMRKTMIVSFKRQYSEVIVEYARDDRRASKPTMDDLNTKVLRFLLDIRAGAQRVRQWEGPRNY